MSRSVLGALLALMILLLGGAHAETMSVGGTIDDFYSTLSGMGITTAIKPLAFAIIGVTVAARCVTAIQTGMSDMIGAAVYGGIAAALVTFSTTTDSANLKDATFGAWKSAYNVAQTKGTPAIEDKLINIGNVFGVVIAGMTVKAEAGMKKSLLPRLAADLTPSAGGASAKAIDRVTEKFAKLKPIMGKLSGILRFLVALVGPIVQSYILTNAVLGVSAMALGLVTPLLLASIAFGTFKPLQVYVSMIVAISVTTLVTPAIFTAAIHLGFVLPLESVGEGLSDIKDTMENFDWFDPFGALDSVLTTIVMVVLTMFASVFAAFQFVQQAPGAILRTLSGGAK